MQIFTIGDNLHEKSKPGFSLFSGENKKNYFKMSSAENFTQHAEWNNGHILIQ